MNEEKLDERYNLDDKNSKLINWNKFFKRLKEEKEKRRYVPGLNNQREFLGRAKLHPLLPPFDIFLGVMDSLVFWSTHQKKEEKKELTKNKSEGAEVKR